VNFAPGKILLRGNSPPKMYKQSTSPGDGQTSFKVWLASAERRLCSNEAKTRNPLKFAWVPKPANRSQPLVGRSSAYCADMWRRYRCLTSFFPLSIRALVAKTQPDKVVRWCPDGIFASFLRLYFQRAACSTFQTCIVNSH